LIQGIQCRAWVLVWPKRLGHVLASRRESRFGEEQTEQSQHLAADIDSLYTPTVYLNADSAKVFDKYARGNAPRQGQCKWRNRRVSQRTAGLAQADHVLAFSDIGEHHCCLTAASR
jgi:hypothetical protein